jgi:hypothetical protein
MYYTKHQEIILCPRCGGAGKIRAGNLREMHNQDIEVCPFCNGDVLFIMVTTVEYLKKTESLMDLLIK